MDVASFNSLLKRIVELALSITSGPESVQVFSLGDVDQPARELQQCEAEAEQTSTSTVTVNINGSDIEVEHDYLRDDSSSEESDEDTDSEEDDSEMQLFMSQLSEQLAAATESGVTELFECLVKIKECFAQEERDNQELFASQLVQEGNLEEIYALSFNLFEGKYA